MTLQTIVEAMSGAKKALFDTLKARRFTGTARTLGETLAEGVQVQIVNQPNGSAAWWNSTERIIVLNDAMPAAKDDKESLVWQRAKLFHELFHVLFTTKERVRQDYCLKANNRDRYLWVSNALEDGRIEYHGGKLFEGTIWFIRTLLKHLVREKSADSGLLIYVRTKLWRNAAEGKFWAKYQAQIDEAITAPNSSIVWKIAFDIVQDMHKPQPKQPQSQPPSPPQPPSDDEGECTPSNDQGNDEGESEESDEEGEGMGEGESDEKESEEGEEQGNGEPTDTPEDAEEDSEGEGGGKSSNEAGDTSTEQQTPPQPPTGKQPFDDDVRQEIKDMIEQALDEVDQEVSDELVELQQEMATFVQEQEYVSNAEANAAEELTEVFASLLVESSHEHFEPTTHGKLDPRRLLEVYTGGVFCHERNERLAQPHIVLLIDESCSMEYSAEKVSEAARILNGAIQACGAKSVAISFGQEHDDTVVIHPVVPKEGFKCDGYHTPTHAALKAAHQWLTEESARRGMVIVITDGIPTVQRAANRAFEDLQNDGFYVLDVLIGKHCREPIILPIEKIKRMCHEWVFCENAKDLVRQVDAPLGNFISGSF